MWEYAGGEAKVMRMLFKPGGRLIFEDGFEYHNPAAWRYSPDLEELTLAITVSKDFDFSSYKSQVELGRIKRFDPLKGEIVYKFTPRTKSIAFAGWIFSKK